MTFKLPKTIKIGESNYKIKIVKIIDLSNNVVGQINHFTKTIKIKLGKDERLNEETFFHELTHGMLKELEFNYPKVSNLRCNEKFVQEMGLTLRTMFLSLKE